MRRLFNILSLASAIALAVTVGLWVWSFSTDPREDCISFGDQFHVAVREGRICFFNDKSYGVYHGSIIALAGANGAKAKVFAEERYFGDFCGVYYRYFRWAGSGEVLWTLAVSLLYPLGFVSLLPGIWLWRMWREWCAKRRILTNEELQDPRRQMNVAIKLYRWMGVIGGAVYLLAPMAFGLFGIKRAGNSRAEDLLGILTCAFIVAFFAYSIHVAQRLATRPAGMLRRARLVAIILATAWCPLLTIPGILCLRRVSKNYESYCELFAKQQPRSKPMN